jgi:hypothetical protein
MSFSRSYSLLLLCLYTWNSPEPAPDEEPWTDFIISTGARRVRSFGAVGRRISLSGLLRSLSSWFVSASSRRRRVVRRGKEIGDCRLQVQWGTMIRAQQDVEEFPSSSTPCTAQALRKREPDHRSIGASDTVTTQASAPTHLSSLQVIRCHLGLLRRARLVSPVRPVRAGEGRRRGRVLPRRRGQDGIAVDGHGADEGNNRGGGRG